jgi:hypothetical protein
MTAAPPYLARIIATPYKSIAFMTRAWGRIKGGNGKNDEVYDGEWVQGKQHGRGRQTWSDGTHYDGEYQSDLRHGKGKETLPGGVVYDGEWADGRRHGEGRLSWPRTAAALPGTAPAFAMLQRSRPPAPVAFKGAFEEGELCDGVLTFTSGDVYEGKFRASAFHGQGKLTVRGAPAARARLGRREKGQTARLGRQEKGKRGLAGALCLPRRLGPSPPPLPPPR